MGYAMLAAFLWTPIWNTNDVYVLAPSKMNSQSSAYVSDAN